MLPIVAVASLIAQGLTDASPIEGVLQCLGCRFSRPGVQIAFWVTVVSPSWSASALPCRRGNGHLRTCRGRTAASGWGDCVRNQRALTLLIWALFWQRDHWQVTIDGELLPRSRSGGLVALARAAAGDPAGDGGPGDRQVPHGRWTVRLATWNTVLNLGFASMVVVLWAQESLLSPGILEAVPGGLLNPVPWIVVAITVFDTAEGWWSLRRGAAPGNSRNHPRALHSLYAPVHAVRFRRPGTIKGES